MGSGGIAGAERLVTGEDRPEDRTSHSRAHHRCRHSRGTHRGHDNAEFIDTDLRVASEVLDNHLSSRWIDLRGSTTFRAMDDDCLPLGIHASAREDLGILACSRLAHSAEATESRR
jgi:hypothetical protein